MLKTIRTGLALLALAASAGSALAQETTIRFTLGWKTQGSDSAFFVARDKGYYKAEGLNVVIDQGEGSGATVTRIMGGAYDAGFGDINHGAGHRRAVRVGGQPEGGFGERDA